MKKLWSALFLVLALSCSAPDSFAPDNGGNGRPGNGGENTGDTGGDKPLPPEEKSDEIVLLFTNDLHSQIEPIDANSTYNADRGGVARIKVLADSVRAAEKAVILADAGDFVQGTFYFTCMDGKVEMEVQKEIGYDIRTIGNHEFDKKIRGLKYMFDLNDVKTVSSNYDFSSTVLSGDVQQSAILEAGGHKIGFIGFGARLEGLVSPKSCEGVKYSYPWNDADRLAEELKNQGAEMVIALSHLGFNYTSNAKYYDKGLAASTENIDFIIGGHSHTFITSPYWVTNAAGTQVPVVQTGCKGIYLGYMKIDLKKQGRDRYSYRLIPVDSRLDARIDPTFNAMLGDFSGELNQFMDGVLGYCPVTLRKGTPQGTLGNWAADALAQICRETFGTAPDMAICNNGGLRAELTRGDVRRKDIYSVFPFDNKLVLLEMQGTVLLQMFDSIAAYTEPISGNVCLKVKNGKVESVTIGGTPVDSRKTYTVCTLDYLSDSDHYNLGRYLTREDSEDFVYDLICDYVRKLAEEGKNVESEIDGRITVE